MTPVSALQFDPENPRLPFVEDRADEGKVLEWMLSDGTIIELMGSIGEQNYFIGEPLLVTPDRNSDNLIVVEGNRRLAAVKLLLNPNLAPTRKRTVSEVSEKAQYRPSELPTITFPERNLILDYLGYRHITGVKEWDPLAKARYLEQLYRKLTEETKAEKLRSVAKTIGSRADYVSRLLTGLAIYDEIAEEDFFGLEGVNERSVKFSLLTTAINYSNVADFLDVETGDFDLESINKNHLEELTGWMFEKTRENRTRLGESRNLSELSSVLGDERALEQFRAGLPLMEAYTLTAGPNNAYRQVVAEARSRLNTALTYASKIDDVSQTDVDIMIDIYKTARAITAVLQQQINDLDNL